MVPPPRTGLGLVDLDDSAADHLPPDLDLNTNRATIRRLLGMRSGTVDYVDALWDSLSTDRQLAREAEWREAFVRCR
jgi:CubicO group peptidase (beta-lactamase class C family)